VYPDHYAILLAINYYPGLRNLDGPANDIEAFAKWLTDPKGGGLDEARIATIKSSDFPPVADPNDANPTERAFIKALNKLVRDPAARWKIASASAYTSTWLGTGSRQAPPSRTRLCSPL